jgi:outer membrane immunogenic protein
MTARIICGGLALAAGTVAGLCSAAAADLPLAPRPVYAPAAYVAPVYNWTGFYIGGHAGGGWENSSWTDPFTGGSNTFNKSGFIAGGQIGGNVQFNWLVVGVEGDLSWSGIKGSGADSIGNSINTNVNWTSTVTGRAGVAFDRLLVYGKGGVAFANDKSSLTDIAGGTASDTLTRTGWTAGAGLEYAFAGNWSAKVEYDYLGFGSQTLNLPTPAFPAYTSSANLNVQEVKFGINYRFGP